MEKSPQKFEESLRELEGIVEKLDQGDLDLEEALAAFEKGVALIRQLGDKLTEVERRVEVLTRDQGGLFQLEPFTEDDE